MHSAPAKIILFGEHAVVYGQPAIAVPFTALSAAADSVAAPDGTGLTIIAHDVGRVLHVYADDDYADDDSPDNALTYAAQLTLRKLHARPPNLTIDIRSTIPVASGFGSGAAVSAALIRELSAALGSPLDGDKLNALVFEVEKMHHGTPSGIDNTVIVKNAPIYFVRDEGPQAFTIGRPFTLVVADSGIAASTRETVGAVRKLYEAEPARYQQLFDQIGSIVRAAKAAIEQGQWADIGQQMNLNHTVLQNLTVSSEVLDRLVQAAREAGALGAKLSGGGRGGNVIALVEPENAARVAAAMRYAGAAHTWVTTAGD
jgi:mevalonate kinase